MQLHPYGYHRTDLGGILRIVFLVSIFIPQRYLRFRPCGVVWPKNRWQLWQVACARTRTAAVDNEKYIYA